MTRGQKGYERRKAKVERQEASRDKEIESALTQRGKLSSRQLMSLGYRKNWRGKWVEK